MPPAAAVGAAVLAMLVLVARVDAQDTAALTGVREAVDLHRRAHELAVMKELRTLLELPNVAADERDIRRNAALLITMLEQRGAEARLLELDGKLLAVYGELNVPDATRTAVLYAHFDGQPVDELDWANPPWSPTLRAGRLGDGARIVDWDEVRAPLPDDWRIYARSASDDKSPIVAFLAALDALREAGIAPSVNLKFFLEGEEEAGSANLRALLEHHRSLLGADVWIFGDGPVHSSGRMQVVYGVRGVASTQLTVYGPQRALHSGHYGNWAPNPAVMLARLIASMRDDDGHIRIDGFYDDVRPITTAERQALAALPGVETVLREELALGRTEGSGEGLMERVLMPALNLTGLAAGGVGLQRRNAIPTEATAALDIRLVPDMDPARVRQQLEAHLRAQGYHVVYDTPSPATLRAHSRVVRMVWENGYAAQRTPLDLPAARAVARVVDEMSDPPALHVPMLGGSLPMSIFDQVLGVPLIIVPMVNADNNQHAANENLRIGNFWTGVRTYAGLIAHLADAWELELQTQQK
jgi:acetylornithine deacetylase/succinyl-diaminopimelate desuccinylase-like protein